MVLLYSAVLGPAVVLSRVHIERPSLFLSSLTFYIWGLGNWIEISDARA